MAGMLIIVLFFKGLFEGDGKASRRRVLLFYYYNIIHRIPRISLPQKLFLSPCDPLRPQTASPRCMLPNR
jgi:hypothetical protein